MTQDKTIWASGYYLSKHLPDDYQTMTDAELDTFIDKNTWEPFQYYSSDQVWVFIVDLASDERVK